MTIRGEILQKAKDLTEGDRNKTYGEPIENMLIFGTLIATFHTACQNSKQRMPETVYASVVHCLNKISRIAVSPYHWDNYDDLTAYAAIAGECARIEYESTQSKIANNADSTENDVKNT